MRHVSYVHLRNPGESFGASARLRGASLCVTMRKLVQSSTQEMSSGTPEMSRQPSTGSSLCHFKSWTSGSASPICQPYQAYGSTRLPLYGILFIIRQEGVIFTVVSSTEMIGPGKYFRPPCAPDPDFGTLLFYLCRYVILLSAIPWMVAACQATGLKEP